MQVSFEPSEERLRSPKMKAEELIDLDLYGVKHKVFSRSDNCYGLREAMKRFIVARIYERFSGDGSIPTEIDNPCVNDIYNGGNRDSWLVEFPMNKSDIFDTDCTLTTDEAFNKLVADLPDGYTFAKSAQKYDETACNAAIDKFHDTASCQEIFAQDCLDASGIPVPRIGQDFFAVSSYFWNFRKILDLPPNTTLGDAEDKVDKICTGPSPDPCPDCSATDCFETKYVLKVLTEDYHFDADTFEGISFVDKVEGETVGWATGLMVTKTAEVTGDALGKSEKGERKISAAIFAILLGFGIVMMLVSAVGVFVFHKTHYNRKLNRTSKE